MKLCDFFPFTPFTQAGEAEKSLNLEQKLYDGVSATSAWLDGVEERLFAATALLPEETETYLYNQEVNIFLTY